MDSPRLMIVFDHNLGPNTVAWLRESLNKAQHDSRPFVIEGAKVYQLIDGRWHPLDELAAPPTRGVAVSDAGVEPLPTP